jgi:hypothetical protein
MANDPQKNPATTFWSSQTEEDIAIKWFLGLIGMWIVLTLMVDMGWPTEVAVAIAVVTATSVVLNYGPDVFKNLGINTNAT